MRLINKTTLSSSSRYTHHRAGNSGSSRAVLEYEVRAVAPHGRVDLGTEARRLGQAPLAAARPAAVVDEGRVDRLAHHGFRLDSRVKGSGTRGFFSVRGESHIFSSVYFQSCLSESRWEEARGIGLVDANAGEFFEGKLDLLNAR